jgi:hypothetical protein
MMITTGEDMGWGLSSNHSSNQENKTYSTKAITKHVDKSCCYISPGYETLPQSALEEIELGGMRCLLKVKQYPQ